jgi:septum formation protein
MDLILASASERRCELLKRITDDFKIIISGFDEESVIFEGDCEEYVKKIAEGKAIDVSKGLQENSIIIGCDTVVFFDNKVLGKPKDREDAFNMLSNLSGNTHQVYSGLAIYDTRSNSSLVTSVKTEVKFSKLTKKAIEDYIDSGEPMDKAGAYGIQGFGGVFVEEIHGCYYNVVGLPINKLNSLLRDLGVNLS